VEDYYPKGRGLPALERAILKYRAFQMMRFLLHVEELKSFVFGSIRKAFPERLPEGASDTHEKMWTILVSEGIVTSEEFDEIQSLIDYHYRIGDRVQQLNRDISSELFTANFYKYKDIDFDSDTLDTIERYRNLLDSRMREKFGRYLTLKRLLFESSGKTLTQEMNRLKGMIRRQVVIRENELAILKSELDNFDTELFDELDPSNPKNKYKNGRLSDRGVECCYILFQHGLSDSSVSYLMRVSQTSIQKRRKKWLLENNHEDKS